VRTTGRVRVWHADEGWGVIDSAATPGGCWAHFSTVLVPGHRALRVDQRVTLEFEPARQDGYAFRALEVWPADQEPYRATTSGPSDAYRSTLTIATGDSTTDDIDHD
jgi:CspA family cold shock protein